ncbi:MAG: hypothetical protein KGV57_01335 [Fusobacterium sp.]|nr:hypothetical protein [Fusobacterium sp.]
MAKKQEIKTEDFDFGNISKINKIIKKVKQTDDDKKDNNEMVSYNFSLHKNIIEEFYKLKQEYAFEKKDYNLSVNRMMSIMITFIFNDYEKKNFIENVPNSFIENVIRRGRRKRNDRTYPKNERENFQILISKREDKMYLEIMYAYLRNNPSSNEFDDSKNTRVYYFYDFIDYIKLHKEEFLKFNLNYEF